MKKFRLTNVSTGEIVCEDYAWNITTQTGEYIPESMVRTYAVENNRLLYGVYRIEDIGDDGVKRRKQIDKLALGMEYKEEDSEKKAKKKRKAKTQEEIEKEKVLKKLNAEMKEAARISKIAKEDFDMSYGNFVSYLTFHPDIALKYGIKA